MTDTDCVRRSTCRLCGGGDLELVLALTPTPPANAFVSANEIASPQSVYPLDVFFCRDCTHVQLLDVVDPALLFENYVYVSGTSTVFVKHFEDYAETVLDGYVGDAEGKLAVDIGSNDGTLLKAFQAQGMAVLGIDPARDIAAKACAEGVETLATFFTEDLARRIRKDRGAATVVTANNVFAHADDLLGITGGVRSLLADDGVFVFEVSYLVDVFEKTLFDTVYHEHLAYHTVSALAPFLAENGMELFAVQRVDSHGGSLRGFAGLSGGPHAPDGSVASLVELERGHGLDSVKTLKAFGAKIDGIKAKLGAVLKDLKQAGKTIAAFGAPAKATTLMYHFDIGPETIDFIVDENPLKQGLFSPGMHIPVLPSQAIYDKNPDAVVILAWNFAEPIMKNHARFKNDGGTFIIPLPEVVVI